MPAQFTSVRKQSANGIPETAEFISELNNLAVSLDLLPKVCKTEAQRAISAVYAMIGGIEGNGLHCFWDKSPTYIREVKRGLKVVGADNVLGILNESAWAEAVVKKGTDKHGHYHFTPDEELRLDIIEDRLYASFVGLPTRLLAFALEHGLLEQTSL
jgi:hypothetical protein